MLTALKIKNFKGIEGPVDIAIKPVTLLYGVNSAGKSSVLHSMHFMRGVLENFDLDPTSSPYAADDIDLGGFSNLIHMHSAGRRMVLGYSLDLSLTDLPEYGQASVLSISEKVKTAYVEFGFSLDDQSRQPKLDYYLVSLNDIDVALVVPDSVQASSGNTRLAYLNLRHPFLESVAESDDSTFYNFELELRKIIPWTEEDEPIDKSLDNASQETINSLLDLRKLERQAEYDLHIKHRDLLKYQVTGFRNGLPRWGKVISSPTLDAFSDSDFNEDLINIDPVVLTELLVGPLELLRDLLTDSRAIGPLRVIPRRHLSLDSRANETDWYSGLAAWYRLHDCSQGQLSEINKWLCDAEHLGTGYQLERVESRDIPQSYLDRIQFGDVSDRESSWSLIGEQQIRKKVWLVDTKNHVQVTPHDVGVGLSQLIPVVVASVDQKGSLLLIEQPELHIHPRVQVGLGDLYLQASKKYKRNFLIETHSEALLLRMMKRIRQTQDGELPEGVPHANRDDVAVYLIQNEGRGVAVMQMRMNERGEFIKPWPKGLFEESLRETF
jgi:hypothetical protein